MADASRVAALTPDAGNGPAEDVGPRMQALIEAHVAEYLALRSEIEWLIKDGSQYQGFAIALLAAALPLLQFLATHYQDAFLATLLVIPFLFCLLGFLYFRQHEEVYVIAAYLARSLRPRVRTLTGDESLWAWEEFKGAHAAHAGRERLGWVTGGRPVLILRALLFLVPSVLAVIIAIGLLVAGRPYVPLDLATRLMFVAAVAFDAAITGLLALYLATKSDLTQRLLQLRGMRSNAGAPPALGRLLWFADRARRPAHGALRAFTGSLSRLLGARTRRSG